jgi:hypothetical protein
MIFQITASFIMVSIKEHRSADSRCNNFCIAHVSPTIFIMGDCAERSALKGNRLQKIIDDSIYSNYFI